MTTFLDLLGVGLLVAAAYLVGGLPAGLALAGVVVLLVSWRASR